MLWQCAIRLAALLAQPTNPRAGSKTAAAINGPRRRSAKIYADGRTAILYWCERCLITAFCACFTSPRSHRLQRSQKPALLRWIGLFKKAEYLLQLAIFRRTLIRRAESCSSPNRLILISLHESTAAADDG